MDERIEGEFDRVHHGIDEINAIVSDINEKIDNFKSQCTRNEPLTIQYTEDLERGMDDWISDYTELFNSVEDLYDFSRKEKIVSLEFQNKINKLQSSAINFNQRWGLYE